MKQQTTNVYESIEYEVISKLSQDGGGGGLGMSKKLKTMHQNLKWFYGTIDTFDWEADPIKVSKEFETESQALEAAREYAKTYQGALDEVIVICSSGNWYKALK
jgi:hypothetical protein